MKIRMNGMAHSLKRGAVSPRRWSFNRDCPAQSFLGLGDAVCSKTALSPGFLQEETDTETDAQPKFPIKFKYIMPAAPPSRGPTEPNLPPPPTAEAAAAAAPPATSTEPGAMTVRVENYSLQFKMSGLTCLSDFIEDEKLPEVIPMSITVKNFLLVLDVSDHGLHVAVPLN